MSSGSIVLLAGDRLTATRDPQSSLRYGFDVAGVLAPGDSVATAVIAGSSDVMATAAAVSGTVVSCRVTGGTVGVTGTVTLRWTTTQGDTDERTLHLITQQR